MQKRGNCGRGNNFGLRAPLCATCCHPLLFLYHSVFLQGLRRPSMPKSFRVSGQFAAHEVGKALVATVLRRAREDAGLRPRLERVERVSMVPRGRCAPPPKCVTRSC